jgi:predicted helicase
MSIELIQQYYTKVAKLIQYGGSRNESSLRKAFQELLDDYARSKDLVLVPEVEYATAAGNKVYPDGTLKDALRQDWGFWESKDEKDDLEAEIKAKFAKGYPNFNILFEDTQTAVLYQVGAHVLAAAFSDATKLNALLTRFVGYEPAEVREFHKAIQLFSAEVGGLAKALRAIIDEQVSTNAAFSTALTEFLELARRAINPKIEMADVREMIIQHVLTEDIFMRVFDEAEFHRDNVIAHKLAEVAGTFYKGVTKHNILARIAPYYAAINARAAQISDHHEKQKFLKALYGSFYRAYNPKAADRLGIIYTPDAIVRFMIAGADHLVFKHFGKTLGDKGVEILDPVTGTGTFITELIEHLPPAQLPYKYQHEMHCNEVAILPYYIANLNIEYTYKQKTGQYKEFENICFVDTLDNMGFEKAHGQQMSFLGLVDGNTVRISHQNERKISVVIGNPPYNAWQENFNNQNANRAYPDIDKRIKETYIKQGTAQNQIGVYDMYTRFIRWGSDRLERDGVIAFVSNNSFLNARSYDGFRKVVALEFNEIYIIDLKGDARTSGERRRQEGGNVFSDEIRVGVAVYFMVRKKGAKGCRIYYNAIADYATSRDKQAYLRENGITSLEFQHIRPDADHNWLNITDNDWKELLPLIDRTGKRGNATFDLFSLGNKSQRDEWVYDTSPTLLKSKILYLVQVYQASLKDKDYPDRLSIKWDRELTKYLRQGIQKRFDEGKVVKSLYRPFVSNYLYFDKHFNGMTYQLPSIFPPPNRDNLAICVTDIGGAKLFMALATDKLPDLHLVGAGASTQCLPFYRFAEDGTRVDNITDWALGQFQKRYKDRKISKENIFHYVYAVLHHSAYRTKYEQNLKREFPRIPFYKDFKQWAAWGKALMELHLNYESAKPFALAREDLKAGKDAIIKPRLIARKTTGVIEVDTVTTLRGVPAEAWQYQLGTYSALEWVLERHKEKTPKDPTIREKFNTYRFAEHKEQVIELLHRVCTVSMQTMHIIGEMPES